MKPDMVGPEQPSLADPCFEQGFEPDHLQRSLFNLSYTTILHCSANCEEYKGTCDKSFKVLIQPMARIFFDISTNKKNQF